MRPDDIRDVDADTWAEHCSDYRTIASETQGGKDIASTMRLKHAETGELIGLVDYRVDGTRTYWIFINRKSPKIDYRKGASRVS